MIDVKEFRVGNWIVDYELEPEVSIYWQIEQVNKHEVWYRNGSCWTTNPEPIQLTEEILLKCGFEKFLQVVKGMDVYDTYRLGIFQIINHYGIYLFNGIQIKHLHQLQNLTFALIGQELQIKL